MLTQRQQQREKNIRTEQLKLAPQDIIRAPQDTTRKNPNNKL
jgi:hypothetical protein